VFQGVFKNMVVKTSLHDKMAWLKGVAD